VGRVTLRRLFAAAAAGVLAVAGLAGCRSNPGVAAYVGPSKITEAQVDKIMADAEEKVDAHNAEREALTPEQVAALPPESPLGVEAAVPSREAVVSTLVFAEVCEQVRNGPGEPPEQIATDQVARAERLPAGALFVQDRLTYYICLNDLGTRATPVTPTEEQLRDLYARGLAAKVFDPEQPFAAVSPQLAANEQVRGAYGLRKALVEAVESRKVTVNPRYRPLELPILVFSEDDAAVVVPLTPVDPDPAVHDVGSAPCPGSSCSSRRRGCRPAC
jgi:hypothetical protein